LLIVEESSLFLGVAATFLLAHFWIERRPLADLGLSWRHRLPYPLVGFVLGFLLQGVTIGMLTLAGWYRVTSIAPAATALTLILQELAMHLLVALVEEGFFRGIVFRLLVCSIGSWLAITLRALFFGLAYLLGNTGATLFGTLAIALEAGILLGVAYILTRDLWLAVGIYWAWNCFEGPFFGATIFGATIFGATIFGATIFGATIFGATIFGATIFGASSTVEKARITSTMQGPQIWTGGAFGSEAGIVAMLACLIASTHTLGSGRMAQASGYAAMGTLLCTTFWPSDVTRLVLFRRS
jgi:membrane protease YdiL (CAAX protease family)